MKEWTSGTGVFTRCPKNYIPLFLKCKY